ncbi:hypothetical protein C8J46_11017 [Sphingomonas sp. PP-F2F-A104-K0414]|nr:hypothetical protein C8J46_11017 [Sphingomonas sp. PP-F2F-A104-K0414]
MGLLLAIEEHVFLSREVIEDRHASDIGRLRDLVDRHPVKATLHEQARGSIGYRLSGHEPLARSTVWGRSSHSLNINIYSV